MGLFGRLTSLFKDHQKFDIPLKGVYQCRFLNKVSHKR